MRDASPTWYPNIDGNANESSLYIRLFFFSTPLLKNKSHQNHIKQQSTTEQKTPPSWRETSLTVVTNHLMTGRHSPLSPVEPPNSRRDAAIALAEAHPRIAPHLMRHACSARLCKRSTLTRLSWPTGQGKTWYQLTTCPNFHCEHHQSNSTSRSHQFWEESLFRLRAVSRNNSRSAARTCGEPSQCIAHTRSCQTSRFYPSRSPQPSICTSRN